MNAKVHLLIAIAGIPALAAFLQSCVVDATPNPPLQSTVHTTYTPGFVVQTLPSGYSTVTYRGSRYYVANGAYFKPQGSQYVVVRSPF